MRSTFKLLFYVNRQKIKANGKCPLMGRITVDGKVCQYATGEEIDPKYWDAKAGRAVVKGIEGKEAKEAKETKSLRAVNTRLDFLEEKAKNAYRRYTVADGYVSAELIKNAIVGSRQAKETLLTLFDEHNVGYARRVGVDRALCSYQRYLTTRKHVANFLRYKFEAEDIALRSLDGQFIVDFHFYLSTILKMKPGGSKGYLIILWKIARLAVKQHTIKGDPFLGYKVETSPALHRHLTGGQLERVMNAKLSRYSLCHTRDLFVFSVFTGLGRSELANLNTDHIITKADGSKWIVIRRQKTNAECYIRLLDIPMKIMEKYKGEGEGKHIFNVPITTILNQCLKKIESICHTGCNLTFYVARHTFATEICLSNGVPIESISKMMGHSKIRTTQIYAEITGRKIKSDFARLAEKTKDVYQLPDDDMPPLVRWGRERGRREDETNRTQPEI